MTLTMLPVSSLEKIFPDEKPTRILKQASALAGEVFSFQTSCYSEQHLHKGKVEVTGDLTEKMTVRCVELSPAEFFGPNIDDNVLRDTPGLYPDLLTPTTEDIRIPQRQWRSFWITITIPEDHPGGVIKTGLKFTCEIMNQGEFSCETTIELKIIPVKLPKQQLLQTQWFHADCIYTHYHVPCWSEEHWELLTKYFTNAANHGINLLLTPLFTPPLDTAIGGERPTNQLVGVTCENGKYQFDLSKLERWIVTAQDSGITHFEFSHLFTQWGAEFTPKIMVTEKNVEIKKFGWHVRADSVEYKEFLDAFLPTLTHYIKGKQLAGKVIFHVSDEPGLQHLEAYKKAVGLIKDHLAGFKIIDALSKVDFYKTGLVENPVPANNHIEEFHALKIPDLWTYYCCSQYDKVPNRFIHFPSARARIMGLLLFKYNLAGFLHWGYNFWYSQYSIKQIDPFRVTDSGLAFPAGDPFLVYPGLDGPLDSIRHEVCFEAIQDLRALRALESAIGRDKVLEIIERDGTLSMTEYPREPEWLLETREIINQNLADNADKE
jgi:Glycoside hydrolase 123, catalytic domain